MHAYVLIRSVAVVSLLVLVPTFGTNTRAQRKNKATAEIFGVVKGADGAPVVLHLLALDDNPLRYYGGYEETAAKLEIEVSGDSGQLNVRVLPDASLPMAEPSVSETCSKSAYPEPAVVLFPDPMFVQEIANVEPELDFTAQLRLFHSTAFGDRNNPTLQILAVPPGHYRALAIQGPGIRGSR